MRSEINHAVITLDKLPLGTPAVVKQLVCESPELEQRLLVMGVAEGVPVEVTYTAPFGDPISVRLMGGALALRRTEAAQIVVELVV